MMLPVAKLPGRSEIEITTRKGKITSGAQAHQEHMRGDDAPARTVEDDGHGVASRLQRGPGRPWLAHLHQRHRRHHQKMTVEMAAARP